MEEEGEATHSSVGQSREGKGSMGRTFYKARHLRKSVLKEEEFLTNWSRTALIVPPAYFENRGLPQSLLCGSAPAKASQAVKSSTCQALSLTAFPSISYTALGRAVVMWLCDYGPEEGLTGDL